MGFFINSHEHSHNHSNGIVFLLGAIFNIRANTDFSNLACLGVIMAAQSMHEKDA